MKEMEMLPLSTHGKEDEVCCGPPPGKASDPDEKPGYRILDFVEEFLPTPIGRIPRIKSRRSLRDFAGSAMARLGILRNNYKVAPGLYAIGNPGPASPVLATANYKLTFDVLRKELSGIDAWILVLDTRGINVWCAAGKGLFSTQELVRRIKESGLERIVNHKNIILPQLCATGVSAHLVKKSCGFEVTWGPVKAEDIPAFIKNGLAATVSMRKITFSFKERVVLIPVEVTQILKVAGIIAAILVLVSGFGPGIFSFSRALDRGAMVLSAFLIGIVSGTVVVPALLPWVPGRLFAAKGSMVGTIGSVLLLFFLRGKINDLEMISLFLIPVITGSYLAMNFTGSTPFTSPSGVEQEMKKALPIQAVLSLFAVVIWICAAFLPA